MNTIYLEEYPQSCNFESSDVRHKSGIFDYTSPYNDMVGGFGSLQLPGFTSLFNHPGLFFYTYKNSDKMYPSNENHPLRDKFFALTKNNWKTPNTYDPNFAEPPKRPGVYYLTYRPAYNSPDEQLVYIGSSTNLLARYKGHEVKRHMIESSGYCACVRFFFIAMDEGFYDYERKLIKALQPYLNKIHK